MRQAVVTTRLLRQSRTARQPPTHRRPDPTTSPLAGLREDEPLSGSLEAVDRLPARTDREVGDRG